MSNSKIRAKNIMIDSCGSMIEAVGGKDFLAYAKRNCYTGEHKL